MSPAAPTHPVPAAVLWLTGLSGAGKSTIAQALHLRLQSQGHTVVVLDGDDLRQGLNKDLGFSPADRKENVRRVAEVARLMANAGLLVVVALISPFRIDRDQARALFATGQFCEVFVDTPLALAEARDPKGLYRRARSGLMPGFTGIDSPYEEPLKPELTITTAGTPVVQAVDAIMAWLASGPGQTATGPTFKGN